MLTFKLSENGDLFHLPLSSLITSVVNVPSVREGEIQYAFKVTLGITRSYDFSYHTADKIIFGMMPMEQFYVAFNTEEHRIGLYQHPMNTNGMTVTTLFFHILIPLLLIDTNLNCPEKSSCKGSQRYIPEINKCKNPICKFYETENDDKECALVSLYSLLLCVNNINSIIVCSILFFDSDSVDIFFSSRLYYFRLEAAAREDCSYR